MRDAFVSLAQQLESATKSESELRSASEGLAAEVAEAVQLPKPGTLTFPLPEGILAYAKLQVRMRCPHLCG